MHAELEKPKEEMQFVVFAIGGEEYAAPILDVKEILKATKITKVPNAPVFVEGIINVRGKIIVVIDLLKRFHVTTESKPQHILIVNVGDNLFGIIVEQVLEVLRTEKDSIKRTPAVLSTKIHSEYLQGVIILGERMVILLNLQKLLSEQESSDVHELVTKAELKGVKEEKRPKNSVDDRKREAARQRTKRRISHEKKNTHH
ncbi:chemotaxis protein CheW [Candidatus Woesearchaeota archaeon]|nr:chemotaxis protein CheW [Candidatus Woesearchaeota archaeon]